MLRKGVRLGSSFFSSALRGRTAPSSHLALSLPVASASSTSRLCQAGYRGRAGVLWSSLFSSSSSSSFQRSRLAQVGRRVFTNTAAPPASAPLHQVPTSMKVWIVGCTATVFGMVVVGGLTRLTESGLSMVDWGVFQMKPPMNQEEWEAEFAKYKQFPEYQKLNPNMDVEGFKRIYLFEWAHRNLGRLLGAMYALPLLYFTARGYLRPPMRIRLYAIAAGIGFQGLLGWYMVKSGLVEKDHPRVSQYRLAAHLGSAFVLYTGMLWTTFDFVLTRPISAKLIPPATSIPGTVLKLQSRMRKYAHGVAGLVFLTAISGAFVAGLDAGLIYTDFPYMGGQLVPTEILDMDPKWRNFTENDVTVQFQHRILGISTFSSIIALWLWSRKVPLSPRSRLAVNALLAMGSLQVSLGISTLYTLVMTHVAASHQAGSLTLLSIATWLMYELKRIPK